MRLPRLLVKGFSAVLMLLAVAVVSGAITIWLATEKDKVQLPRVIGMNSTTALELLRARGLQPKVSGQEFNETVPKDAVLFQRPASGSWVRKNSEVRLVLSQGGDAVALPKLSGLPLPEAEQLLQRFGFTLSRVVRVHSSERPTGEVIAQDPEAGALVRRGSPVAVLLSLGPLEEPAPALTSPSSGQLELSRFRDRPRFMTLIARSSYRAFIVKAGALIEKPSEVERGATGVLAGAGDIASCAGDGDEATASLLDAIDGTVFTLGDNAYPSGTPLEFAACYDPSWGRHKSRTRPTPGNHDYHTRGAFGYFDYFGHAAGDPGKGYYSYDLGSWHIIALNSNCSKIGGCGPGSPQEQWLRADLAATRRRVPSPTGTIRASAPAVMAATRPLTPSGGRCTNMTQTSCSPDMTTVTSGLRHRRRTASPIRRAASDNSSRALEGTVFGSLMARPSPTARCGTTRRMAS